MVGRARFGWVAATLALTLGCSSDTTPADAGRSDGPVDAVASDGAELEPPDVRPSDPDLVGHDLAPLDVPPDVPAPPHHPLDDVLRLNELRVRGTHNSYHVATTPSLSEDWDFTLAPLDVQAEEQGVRQFELDVHYTAEHGFRVYHVFSFDQGTTCETFTECLEILERWSAANPGHHLLYVLVEPKDTGERESIAGHYDELDAAILAAWPRERVLTPDDVRGDHATLREALLADGWPTLATTRGRALFALNNRTAHRTAYLEGHPNLEGRVMFARDGRGEPWSAILEHGGAAGNEEAIREELAERYLIRITAGSAGKSLEERRASAEAALASGAQIISTDYPVPDADGFSVALPGGVPADCAPLTAPSTCAEYPLGEL